MVAISLLDGDLMKTVAVFITVFLTLGCATTNHWQHYANHPGKGLYRYENEEVVCYTLGASDSESLQCKFKPIVLHFRK